MSIVSHKATEQSLQSFLERITQIEKKRCKDDTHQSAAGKQIDYETIDENKSHLQQHLKPWSTIKKSRKKDIFEKNSDLGGNFRVQWTLEHTVVPKHVPYNQNDKPLEISYLQSECACVEQKHEAAQSVHDRLYDFGPELKDSQQNLPTSYFYLKDNQQGVIEEQFYQQQQVPFLEKPKLSYQAAWRSESPGWSYPFQQNQVQNDEKETNPECCESNLISIANGESPKATMQSTQASSRTKSHVAEPLKAFHPPPPPLQLRQKTNYFPLELLPAPKRVQLLPSEYNYINPSFHVLPPSLPLTPVVSPVVKFVTPGHQVSVFQRMPSSNNEMEQNQNFQQHHRQLHEHQRLQFPEQHQHYQQELLEYQQEQQRLQHSQPQQEMYHVQEQQHYHSQSQQPFCQQQHFDYEQSQQQKQLLPQHEQPDETICIVERIYFSSPKNESEEITKTLSVVTPQQEEEYQPDVAYSTPLTNKTYLLQKQESLEQYDRKHASFEVVSENEHKVLSHLYLQEIEAPAVSDFPDVEIGKPYYEFEKAHGDQLITRKEFQTLHEPLQREAFKNSKCKQKTQLRCSTKARKQRLQRESIIRVQTANHQDTADAADEIPQNASFHSPPRKKQALNDNNKDDVVQITKRDVSTQANIGCCCMK